MSVRNLDRLFRPRSVVLVGGSRRAGSVGGLIARNLADGGFQGRLMGLHPQAAEIAGIPCWPAAAALPEPPDLAVVATPAAAVPGVIRDVAAAGARAAVVITAGFGEGGHAEGAALRQAMMDAARPHLLRIAGPNCLGVMAPWHGLNAGFAHIAPKPGRLACVAQSGAVIASILDWADARGIGFSHLVSLGDMADVDFGDMLDYLAADPHTGAILLYIEAVTHARKFMSAARAASRAKPVIVIKAGRHEAAANAVRSHTGSLAGADEVYEAAFRRAGALRVYSLAEFFDAAATLATARRIDGDRLAIVTNGGGVGILATDALMDLGGTLAPLAPETVAALDAVLPANWSRANPVDIIGDADGPRYAAAIAPLLSDPGVDAVLALNCPTAVADGTDAARAVADAARDDAPPILACWLGGASADAARPLFAARHIPDFPTPGSAVRGFMYMVRHRRAQAELMETPPSLPDAPGGDAAAVTAIIDDAMKAVPEGGWLDEARAKALLAAAGIPTTPVATAATPAEAAVAAERLGLPAALKILSPDIAHKSDVGGVALDLPTARAVQGAAEAMLKRVAAARPDAAIAGFTVQPMVRAPGAVELILGAHEDPQFGPVILFGHGGTAVEAVNDTALGLPPLNLGLARALMAGTRVHRLLLGYRDRPPAALDDIALALVRLAQLVVDHAEIAELDINPLLAMPDGVIALDARVRLVPADGPPTARLAIRPYPRELETQAALPDGETVLLRPVRPEDEPLFHAAFARLSPEAVRLRFFAPLRQLSHEFAARLTQIDYDREMALVALPAAPGAAPELYGVARFAADPDGDRAEYAVTVRSDRTGRGLATALMNHLIGYARSRGLQEIHGAVLAENTRMLALCRALGFTDARDPEDGTVMLTTLDLTKAT
jgi:acetyltransferase